MGAGLRRWIREPLLHFFVAGALLFGVYDALDRKADEPRDVVRITATDLEWLRASWTRQHGRPPDDRELRHLVSDYVREELLAREYPDIDEPTVTNLFGRAFAEAVLGLEGGTWRGPFRSAYGFRLVRVTDRQAAAPLEFEAVRERVREDWLRDQKSDADDLLLRSLLAKYELVVEEAVEPWLGPLASAER